ncbi:MAG: hypothetical protein J6C86_03010 [Bacteroidaceae bacterium]|nr:hypothetical protein [Bacteroidaceae bacterium]
MRLSKSYTYINVLIKLLTIVMTGTAFSCSDDDASELDFTVAGAPARISVDVVIPDMQVQTRAQLPEDHANRVESLWLRVYSATTGKATSKAVTIDPSHTDSHVLHKIDDIETVSGPSYIAAVANIDNTNARRYSVADDGTVTYEDGILKTFLEEADTWEKFCAISVLAPVVDGTTSVSMPLDVLPMCGVYYENNLNHGLVDWEDSKNAQPVYIPTTGKGVYELRGAIHLRRLVSHVTFNLIPDNGVTIIPQSYSVRNVPKESWVYERSGKDDGNVIAALNSRNVAGMTVTAQNNTANALADTKPFSTAYIESGKTAGTYTFDFYQMENKHEGLEGVLTYNDREAEYKAVASNDGSNNTNIQVNTGIYKSLCGTDKWEINNTATFVEIRCQVVPGNIKDKNPEDTAHGETTFGNAVFTVHLGYCEGEKEEEKAQDFKCRRNTDYTYNIHIAGVNSIYVEAFSSSLTDETVPGMEGTVTRITGGTYDLDAHYGVFNVCLSNAERTGQDKEIGNGFGFIIQAYENGVLYDINEDNYNDFDSIYYNWIEFIPTTGQDVLAPYPKEKERNEKIIKITEMIDLEGHPHTAGDTDKSDTKDKWYTVHVNENVYETSADETGGRWKKYVNQPSRYCWIKVNRRISPDKESLYVLSKYSFSQKSIQTYYNVNMSENIGALGVEHRNESRGLNLRAVSQHVESESNGRNNYLHYINWADRINYQWDKVLDKTQVQTIGAVNTQGVNYPAYTLPSKSDNVLTVPMLKTTVTEDEVRNNTGMGSIGFSTDYEPQPGGLSKITDLNQFMEAANACANRNRDNNGDGRIDVDEVRWYIPTMGKYLRIILGRNSLTTPLMDYSGVGDKLYYPQGAPKNKHGDKQDNTRFKAYSSDRKVLWAMEGLSVSNFGHSWTIGCWEVRCVRNLGTNLSLIMVDNNKDKDGTTQAFISEGENTVSLKYYDARSVRPYRDTPLPIHDITNQQYNMCARKFEYSKSEDKILIRKKDENTDTDKLITAIENDPCKTLNNNKYNGFTNWRVPNQKEISIMRNLGLITGSDIMLSCTHEYFDINGRALGTGDKRLLVATGTHTFALSPENNNQNYYVRCVRDVE